MDRRVSYLLMLIKNSLEPQPFESCLKKQESIKDFFKSTGAIGENYEKIIELGKLAPLFPLEFKTEENIVSGCQSVMHLHSYFENGKVLFLAESEALISRGLAALLVSVYSGESPTTILTCPPVFLQELGIPSSLSPSRSNGLSSLFLRMKQDALKFLLKN